MGVSADVSLLLFLSAALFSSLNSCRSWPTLLWSLPFFTTLYFIHFYYINYFYYFLHDQLTVFNKLVWDSCLLKKHLFLLLYKVTVGHFGFNMLFILERRLMLECWLLRAGVEMSEVILSSWPADQNWSRA